VLLPPQVDFNEIKDKLDRLKAAFVSHKDSMKGIEDAILTAEKGAKENDIDYIDKSPALKIPEEVKSQKIVPNKSSICSAAFSMKEKAKSDIHVRLVQRFLRLYGFSCF